MNVSRIFGFKQQEIRQQNTASISTFPLCVYVVLLKIVRRIRNRWIYESLQKIRDKVYQLKYQRFEKYLLSLVIWELMFQTPPLSLLEYASFKKYPNRTSMVSITVSSSHNQCKKKLPFMIIFIFTR